MSSKTRLIIIDYDFFEFEGIVSSSSVVIAGPTLFLSSFYRKLFLRLISFVDEGSTSLMFTLITFAPVRIRLLQFDEFFRG